MIRHTNAHLIGVKTLLCVKAVQQYRTNVCRHSLPLIQFGLYHSPAMSPISSNINNFIICWNTVYIFEFENENKNENALFEFEFENVNVKSDLSNGIIDFNEFVVLNTCIIVGASILISREYTDDTRFIVFYTLSFMCLYSLYEVTSTGQIDIYESAVLTILWFLYVALLIIDEPLQYWFNARLPCCDESNDTQREYGIKNKGEFKAEIEFMGNITSDPKGNANGADAGNAGDATETTKEEVEASQRPQIIALKNYQSANKAIAKNTKKSTFGGILKPSISKYDPVDNDRADGADDGNKRANKMSGSVSRSSHATQRKTTKYAFVRHILSRINNGMYYIAIFVDNRTVSALGQTEPSI